MDAFGCGILNKKIQKFNSEGEQREGIDHCFQTIVHPT
jgi:hypothetical protein